jgi:hypothetical protein
VGTYSALATALSVELRDPTNLVWDSTDIAACINEGVIEVGRIAPDRFQADITVVANQLVYTVQNGDPEIELKRVEVWDTTTTPDTIKAVLAPMSAEPLKSSATGWECWNGKLYLPPSVVANLIVGTHVLRVWGYGPYSLVSGSTEMPMSTELEWAVRAYARVCALEILLNQRNRYTQWQTQPGNTDVTPGALLQQIAQARAAWERRAQRIIVLREAQ